MDVSGQILFLIFFIKGERALNTAYGVAGEWAL
jgi:hypothetical protein